MEPCRAAIYYAPAADDPLWAAGCAWLGRDPETGAPCAPPALPGLAAATAAPARYGFHATLKAPMRLRHGLAAFIASAERLAAGHAGFALPPLALRAFDGFLALCLARPCPALHRLADACVTGLDAHRRPEPPDVRTARGAGRDERQRANIERWGYPLVLEAFRFHMTLTGRQPPGALAAAAARHFAAALAQPRRMTGIAVFTEAEPGAPFSLIRRLAFGAP